MRLKIHSVLKTMTFVILIFILSIKPEKMPTYNKIFVCKILVTILTSWNFPAFRYAERSYDLLLHNSYLGVVNALGLGFIGTGFRYTHFILKKWGQRL